MNDEDLDIEILKAKKMKEIRERMIKQEKEKKLKQMQVKNMSPEKEAILSYIYDRGDEVLALAELQFPEQTKIIINRILELIKDGEITKRISGGELLFLFRSLGLNIKVKTTIKIEDHGKYVSFADKLKRDNENDNL